jgi:DNA-binding NarL/FixJ family response regulator
MAEPAATHAPAVTDAEAKVLQRLLRGLSNRAIAADLVISPRTVESHLSHLLSKTGCSSRTQLLLWALARR